MAGGKSIKRVSRRGSVSNTNCLNSKFETILAGNIVYSTITKEHIPKRHLDFENPIVSSKQFDDKSSRIYGAKQQTCMIPTSNAWGTGKNAADLIPRVG